MNNDPKTAGRKRPPLVPRRYLLTFILITSLFALWGFANDITNPMVAASDGHGAVGRQGIHGTVRILRRLRHHGHTGRTVHTPLQLQDRHIDRARPVCRRSIPVHPGSQPAAVLVLLRVTLRADASDSHFSKPLPTPTSSRSDRPTTPHAASTSRKRFNPVGSLSGMAIASLIVLPNLLPTAATTPDR